MTHGKSSDYSLMALTHARLGKAHSSVGRMIKDNGIEATVAKTKDRREAIRDVDYLIVMIWVMSEMLEAQSQWLPQFGGETVRPMPKLKFPKTSSRSKFLSIVRSRLPTDSGSSLLSKSLSNEAEYASLLTRWSCRKVGAGWGIHEMAIPYATQAEPGPPGDQTIRQRPFSLLAGFCPRAKALRTLAPRPRLAKN